MTTKRPPLPPFQRTVLRLTGALALLAFLLPTAFVVKYFAVDAPHARSRAAQLTPKLSPTAKRALLEQATADNLLLQERVAKGDTEVALRREATQAMGRTLRVSGLSWRHPLEAATAKATLADVATHDADPGVRAAAAEALSEVAQAGGAVIRR